MSGDQIVSFLQVGQLTFFGELEVFKVRLPDKTRMTDDELQIAIGQRKRDITIHGLWTAFTTLGGKADIDGILVG